MDDRRLAVAMAKLRRLERREELAKHASCQRTSKGTSAKSQSLGVGQLRGLGVIYASLTCLAGLAWVLEKGHCWLHQLQCAQLCSLAFC